MKLIAELEETRKRKSPQEQSQEWEQLQKRISQITHEKMLVSNLEHVIPKEVPQFPKQPQAISED